MQPQVDGNLTRIYVHSGDAVKAGQVLMHIDPLKQLATVQQQRPAGWSTTRSTCGKPSPSTWKGAGCGC